MTAPSYTATTYVDNSATVPVSASNLNKNETQMAALTSAYNGYVAAPPAAAGIPRYRAVFVADESGGTDDAKITSALAYAAAQTYQPTLIFSPKSDGSAWSWTSTHTLHHGCQLDSLAGFADEPRSAGNVTRISSSMTGPMWTVTQGAGVQTHGIYIGNIQWQGSSVTDWFQAGTGQLQSCVFHNLGFSLFKSVMGTSAQQVLATACTWSGRWNINNARNRQLVIGGSDNSLDFTRCLLDSDPVGSPMTSAPAQYLMQLAFLDKTHVRGMYVTGDRNSPLLITGSSTLGSAEGALILSDCVFEGRNASTPTYGASVRITGGAGQLQGVWTSYAMSDPGTVGRGDLAVIHQEAGDWQYQSCVYRPTTRTASITTTSGSASIGGTFTSADVSKAVSATGVTAGTTITAQAGSSATLSANATASGSPTATIFPVVWLYVGATGRAVVRCVQKSGTMWSTAKPVVWKASGADVDADSSVTVVTV